jgi:hypothetical protein
MRQAHPAGERMFVDYAGQTVDVVDPGTSEIRPAQIFVAVMGASNYTYAEADKRPGLADCDVSWNIAVKRSIIKALPQALREMAEPVERALAQVRAVVEHPFHIVKSRFHYKKLHYRGLHKNSAQLYTLFALANLVIVKRQFSQLLRVELS